MDNTTPSARPTLHARTPLGRWVQRQINALMFGGVTGTGERLAGYKNDDSKATAVLARLRAGIGKPLGNVPELLEWTIAGLPAPENGHADDDKATAEEWAAYTALTLYALHQRSLHADPMHREGVGFGAAIGQLAGSSPNEPGIYRRFSALQTADDKEEVTRHARGLIQLLHAKRIPFDYAVFAEDLVMLEDHYRRDRVRLRWGREYFHARRPAEEQS